MNNYLVNTDLAEEKAGVSGEPQEHLCLQLRFVALQGRCYKAAHTPPVSVCVCLCVCVFKQFSILNPTLL